MSIRREMGFRSAIVIVVVALSFASPWDVPYVRAENLEPHPPILILLFSSMAMVVSQLKTE